MSMFYGHWRFGEGSVYMVWESGLDVWMAQNPGVKFGVRIMIFHDFA
jgi:hypothetical protein